MKKSKIFVVKSKRLKNYLYCLGLNYRQEEDRNDNQRYVYLFEYDEKIEEALKFYKQFKKKYIYKDTVAES